MSEQWKKDYMFFLLRKMIELEKKGTTVDALGINRGLNSEEVVRDAKARQVMAHELTEWAESHQEIFGKKSVEHGLTETGVGTTHAETVILVAQSVIKGTNCWTRFK